MASGDVVVLGGMAQSMLGFATCTAHGRSSDVDGGAVGFEWDLCLLDREGQEGFCEMPRRLSLRVRIAMTGGRAVLVVGSGAS